MKQRLLMLLSVFMAVTSVGWLHAADTSPKLYSDLMFARPGVPVVLSVTSEKGNVADNTMVRVKLDVTKNGSKDALDLTGWKLRYYEANVPPLGWKDWTPEDGVYMFGPKAGFPFKNATSYVELTAPAGSEGKYQVNLSALKVSDSESVISMPNDFTVTANPQGEEYYQGRPICSIGKTDYASVYNAVQFAPENGTIQLTKGNYSLNKSLRIVKPMTIVGAGTGGSGSAIQPIITVVDGKEQINWQTPEGQEDVNDYKHLIVIEGAATGTVTLQNMNVVGSIASGINAQSAMKTVLNKVGMIKNAHAGLLIHSEVEATGIYTVDNVWGGVNIDQGRTKHTPFLKFDATSSFGEASQIWSELVSVDADKVVSAPTGWINYIPADKTTQRFWTNWSLTSEFYQNFPNKPADWNKGYTFVYANGKPITVDKNATGDTVIISVDGTKEKLEIEASKNAVIFGGAKNAKVASSSITMKGGNILMLFGGGYGEASKNITAANAQYAGVTGSTSINVTGGTIFNSLLGGGLYYNRSKDVAIKASGSTEIKQWLICGGFESGVTAGDNYLEFDKSNNSVETASLTIDGGTYFLIAAGGTDGAKGYTRKSDATIQNATITGGIYGNGSNGRSDNVTATVKNCTFVGSDIELAAVNRGIANSISYTFDGCDFSDATSLHANFGATYHWKEGYTGSSAVSGNIMYTFKNCTDTPTMEVSDGLDNANVAIIGAKARIAKFATDGKNSNTAFTIGKDKTWSFNDGLAIAGSDSAATLTNSGTLAIPVADIMAGVQIGGALQVKAASSAVIVEMNKPEKKEDLSSKDITIACTDGIIATNKDTAKELLKAGKSVFTLAYNEKTGYSAATYTQQLAAITNLPASVVYGAAPVTLAFNIEDVTATVKDDSPKDVVGIKDGVLTILKPGTVTLTLTAKDTDASSTQDLTVTKRTVKVTEGITATKEAYNGNREISVTQKDVKFAGILSAEASLSLTGLSGELADANAGDKKQVNITATLAGDSADYYELAPITFVTAKVAPKAITITADAVSRNYGEEKAFSVGDFSASLIGEDVLDGVLKFDCAATKTSPEGTYAIKPYGLSNPNYAITYTSANLTVSAVNPTVKMVNTKVDVNGQQRDITLTAEVTSQGGAKKADGVLENVTFSYTDGEAKTLAGTKNTDGTYSAKVTVAATAKTYNFTATAKVTGSAEKTSTASEALAVAIDGLTPQNIAFVPAVTSTLTYGKSMTLAATGSSIANAVYTYEVKGDAATLTDGVLKAVKAGTVTIVAKQAGNETTSAATATKTIEITPKPITVAVGTTTKQYDGKTTITTLPAFPLSGLETADNGKVSVKAPELKDLAFANKNVTATGKTWTVSIPTLTLTGDAAANYTLVQPKKEDVKGTITKAPLTVKVNDVTRMWNQRYTKYEFSIAEGTLAAGETLTSVYSGSFDVKEEGDALKLTVNSALCPNYELKGQDGTLTVNKGTPAAIVVKIANQATGLLVDKAGYAEEDLTLSEVDETGFVTISSGNDTWKSLNAYKESTPAPANLLLSMPATKAGGNEISWNADDKAQAVTFAKGHTYSLGEGTFASSNTSIVTVSGNEATVVGTGEVAIYATDGSKFAYMNITPASLKVTATMEKTYDGTTQATGTVSLDAEATEGLDVALDLANIAFNFNSKDAAKDVLINPSQKLVLTGSEANNYDLDITGLKAEISKKDLNITSVSKYYDGLATATLTDYATTDLVGGDIVPATVTFNKADIDATLTAVTIAGNGNYDLKSTVAQGAAAATNGTTVTTTGSILKSTIIAKLPTEGSSTGDVKNKITYKVQETGADITSPSAAITNSVKVDANGNQAYFVSAVANDNFDILFDGNQQIGFRADDGGDTGGDDDATVTGITLDKTELTLPRLDTYTLKATIAPSTITGKTISWTSSDDKIATVDATGKVTAVGIGEAIIIASVDGVSATCKVMVSFATSLEEAIVNTRVYGKDGAIRIEPVQPMDVMVVNMVGQVIYNSHIDGATQITVSASGIYAVKLGSGSDAKVKKVNVK